MKQFLGLTLGCLLAVGLLAGCGQKQSAPEVYAGTQIHLSDSGITVDGTAPGEDSGVFTANDIVYYEDGKDFTYGEGTADDAHSAQEAASHTVVHITKPGQYVLSGKLSKGQVAVDLGKDAEDDPEAVVTLVLNGVDITCEVAPAVIFYNVYECGSDDSEDAKAMVDTAGAGANVIIADGTENNVSGAYVAKIYKPDSVELNESGTEVTDAKKLHKYDATFYSKKSMNLNGGSRGDGVLNIMATNEGLDSELHLTINGGVINIRSGNDGINTNEDGVSVTTVNGGTLNILVTGETGEGDGIDSNGWLVINGGTVIAQACGFSADSGIDSDMGIHINGGTVIATGNMLDAIEESKQNFAVFQFAATQNGGTYTLKNEKEQVVIRQELQNRFGNLIVSSAEMTAGNYTLWNGDTQMQGAAGGQVGGFGGMGFGGMNFGGMDFGGQMPGGMPEGMTPPEGMEKPENMPQMPEGMPEGENWPQGQNPGGVDRPDGAERPGVDGRPGGNWNGQGFAGELSENFSIEKGGNYFQGVTPVQ